VVATGFAIGLLFMVMLVYALRALKVPISSGIESLVGKIGTARTAVAVEGGQVQLGSELWSAESVDASDSIGKGDRVEVVEVKGLRLKVRRVK
jgi:membrane protein implicated in regulation of membrane protease activity